MNRPVTAAAAAIAGETKWVRPPLPCRPSKLRLLVAAQLARFELIGVHRKAHAAAGLAPLKPGFHEYLVEPFLFGLFFDQAAARDDHGADAAGNSVSANNPGGCPEVLDSTISARPDDRFFGLGCNLSAVLTMEERMTVCNMSIEAGAGPADRPRPGHVRLPARADLRSEQLRCGRRAVRKCCVPTPAPFRSQRGIRSRRNPAPGHLGNESGPGCRCQRNRS